MVRARALQLALLFVVVAAPATGAAVVTPDSPETALPHEEVENSDGNITVLRGPGQLYESIDAPDDLTAARDAGRVRSPQFLAPGDLLVLQFESDRVATDYAATEGRNATDRFFTMLDSTGTNVSILGLNHGTEQLPSKLKLNRSNVKVLYEEDTDTFSLLIDTANVSVVDREDGDAIRQTLEHREIQAVLEIPTGNETRVLTGSARFEGIGTGLRTPVNGTAIDGFRTPTIAESAAEELRIVGTTPFLPNTNLTVRASVSNGSTLVVPDVETYNANDSTAGFGHSEFNTTLPLPDADADDTVEVVVVKDGTVLTERTILIGQQPRMSNTSARLVSSGPHEGNIAITATLRLPEPGLLLMYVDGEARSVAVPEHETVERTLYVDKAAVDESGHVYVLALWDRNENGVHDPDIDTLYTTTSDVGASVEDRELDTQVRVDGWPPETSTSTNPTQEPSTTASERTSDRPSTTEPTATTTPGFGVLVGLLSIGCVALLVRRYSADR
ncbi:PGF-CTERM sorting domain-containing protein [Halobaculum sp. EA56]|uniref:PGF-CTERM sorting domain-containing protein n=1 Tax=Halobaculum sp. EA56 TaxID=3421648 RepID=UPI003EB9B231